MKYIIIIDEKFFDFGKAELDSIITDNTSKFMKLANRFFLFECNQNIPSNHKFSFIEGIVPVEKIDCNINDYEKIAEAIKSMLNKNKSFKIEALNLNVHNEHSAKDIEVKLGTILESQGYSVDLKNPLLNVYLFLSKPGIFIGSLPSSDSINANQFRFSKKSAISRAQFKLEEALNFFKINNLKIVMDIGAAPGGWSLVMLSRGAKVIAVDNALLNYKELLGSGSKKFIIFSDSDEHFDNYTKEHTEIIPIKSLYSLNLSDMDFDLCHIKEGIEKIDFEKLNIKVDALLIDMNIAPAKSAEEACKLSKMLNDNGLLLMTVKLVDDNINKNIKDAEDVLAGCYKHIELKRLPHNRKEITLFAKLK